MWIWMVVAINTQTDNNGNYSVTFPDIPRGAKVRYATEAEIDYASVTFHTRFQDPRFDFLGKYDDYVGQGRYEAGHTVWITVTESNGMS